MFGITKVCCRRPWPIIAEQNLSWWPDSSAACNRRRLSRGRHVAYVVVLLLPMLDGKSYWITSTQPPKPPSLPQHQSIISHVRPGPKLNPASGAGDACLYVCMPRPPFALLLSVLPLPELTGAGRCVLRFLAGASLPGRCSS